MEENEMDGRIFHRGRVYIVRIEQRRDRKGKRGCGRVRCW